MGGPRHRLAQRLAIGRKRRLGAPIAGRKYRCLAVTVLLSAFASPAAARTLDEAYKRELSLLQAEKAALKQALVRGRKTAAAARAALEADITRTTSMLAQLKSTNASHDQTLVQREQRRNALTGKQALDAVHRRIEAWLVARGESAAHRAHGPDALPPLIARALSYIERISTVRVEPDTEVFFDDGVARRVSVLRVAEVGALIWDTGCRPLIPTPDGALRTVPGLKGQRTTLREADEAALVLYDPRRPPRKEAYAQTGWRQWMAAGGLLMWPLVVLALLATAVALERATGLFIASRRWRVRALAVNELVAARRWDQAATQTQGTKGTLARVLAVVLQQRHRRRAEIEEAATEGLLGAQPGLSRGLSILSVTAAAAPLLGLLGTVTGMIRTFSVITHHGTGDPRLLSGGISEALLTTQLGLAVAIPALVARTGLARWAARIFARAEGDTLDLIHRIEDINGAASDEHTDGGDHGDVAKHAVDGEVEEPST